MSILPEQNRDDIEEIKKDFGDIRKKMQSDKEERDDYHCKIMKEIKKVQEEIKELSEKVNPLVRWFDNINFGKKALMWVLGVIGSIVGIAIGIKSLFK